MKRLTVFALAMMSLMALHGQNIALTATPSASASSSGSYGPSNWNDGMIGPMYYFGWLGTAPTFSQPAWLQYEWSSPATFNHLVFHPPTWSQPGFVYFTGSAEVHYWDGAAWVNHHSFGVAFPGIIDTVSFPMITTTKVRVTNFIITGAHNPGWDEIEVLYIPPVVPPVLDVAICAILEPVGNVLPNTPYTVRVLYCNQGPDTIYGNVPISYATSDGSASYTSGITLQGGLAPGDTFVMPFTVPIYIVSDTLELCAWTHLPGDVDPTNDTMCVMVYLLEDPGIGIPQSHDPQEELSVYPNPTSGSISLKRHKSTVSIQWTLFDTTGRMIASGYLPDGETQQSIHLPHLAPGLYLLHTNTANQSRSHKVLVE